MMKDDEKRLLEEFQKRTIGDSFPHGRMLAKELNIPEKRAAYIFEKWSKKDWYDYGVSVMAGWLTEKGLSQLLNQNE